MINTRLYHPGSMNAAAELITAEGQTRTAEVTRTKAQDEDHGLEIDVAVETDIVTGIQKINVTIILLLLSVRIEATEVTKVMEDLVIITTVTETRKDVMTATFPTETATAVGGNPLAMTPAETSIVTTIGLTTRIREARANIIGIRNQPKNNAITRTHLIGKGECDLTITAPSQVSL